MEELFLDPNPEQGVLVPGAGAVTKVRVELAQRTEGRLATSMEGSGWDVEQIHLGHMGQNQSLGKFECLAEELRFQKCIYALHLCCQGFCC